MCLRYPEVSTGGALPARAQRHETTSIATQISRACPVRLGERARVADSKRLEPATPNLSLRSWTLPRDILF